jgi:hypothetical protein
MRAKEVGMFAASGRCVCVTSAVILAVGVWAASGLAATVPSPCTLVSTATIASTLGVKGTVASGKLTTRPDGKVKQDVCTFTVAGTQLQIDAAPHEPVGGSGGGAPGMKSVTPTGLGSAAEFFYDTRSGFQFASVSFTKGNIDAGVYEHGTLAHERVLALAKLVYNALP